MLDYAALQADIAARYPGNTDSQAVAVAFNALTQDVTALFYVQSRTILADIGPDLHKALMATVRAAYPDLIPILESVGPTDGTAGGVDVSRADVRAFIDGLVGIVTGFTTDHASAIKAHATKSVGYVQQAYGAAALTAADVMRAWGQATTILTGGTGQ